MTRKSRARKHSALDSASPSTVALIARARSQRTPQGLAALSQSVHRPVAHLRITQPSRSSTAFDRTFATRVTAGQSAQAVMLSPTVASAPAAAHSKPRMRAQTLTSPPDGINLTPSLSRSYRQPVGTGSLRRMQQQQQSSLGHSRSRSQGDAMSALAAGPSTPVKGKRRAVVCDVVLEDVETDEDARFAYPTGTYSCTQSILVAADGLTFVHRAAQHLPQLARHTCDSPSR